MSRIDSLWAERFDPTDTCSNEIELQHFNPHRKSWKSSVVVALELLLVVLDFPDTWLCADSC
jgi:hypothetical protein